MGNDTHLSWDSFGTPLGRMVCLLDAAGRLRRLEFEAGRAGGARALVAEQRARGADLERSADLAAPVRAEVEEFLAGERTRFDLRLDLEGTEFQRAVWSAVRRVRYGETLTYLELAERVGHPGAVRAVGRANATNPVSLVVPCHRLVGVDGSLRGYGGTPPVKHALLALEAAGGDADARKLLAAARRLERAGEVLRVPD